MALRRLFGLLLLAAPLSAAEAADTLWTHNGSVVRYLSEDGRRLFMYEEPRAGLAGEGVRPGTILFDGARTGNRLFGQARIFKRGCRRLSYPVEGILVSETDIVLSGMAPRFAAGGCEPEARSGSDSLEFRYLRRATTPRPLSDP